MTASITIFDKRRKVQEEMEAIELDYKGRVKKRTAKGKRRKAAREAKRARELESRKNRMEQFNKYLVYRDEL